MIRALAMIAVAGFLVSVVTLAAAVGIAGPDAIAHGAWSWGPDGWGSRHWNFGHHDNHFSWGRDDDGPQTTREIAWSGGDALTFDLPADVQYTQGSGPAKLTVTGPQDAVSDVEVENGHLQFSRDRDHDAHLTITITAPSVTSFTMESSGKLTIANYRQDKLNLELEGDADVAATGETKAIQLNIAGSADADLGAVKAQSAKVDIEGSGDATLAPTDAADINVEGSGEVTLLTHPGKLQSHIAGSGRIRQKDGGTLSNDG